MNNTTIQSGYQQYDHQTEHSDEEYSSHGSAAHDATRPHSGVRTIIQRVAGYNTLNQSQYHVFDAKIIKIDGERYEKDTTNQDQKDDGDMDQREQESQKTDQWRSAQSQEEVHQVCKNDEFLRSSIEKELKELLAKQERAYNQMDQENNLDRYLKNQLQEYFLGVQSNQTSEDFIQGYGAVNDTKVLMEILQVEITDKHHRIRPDQDIFGQDKKYIKTVTMRKYYDRFKNQMKLKFIDQEDRGLDLIEKQEKESEQQVAATLKKRFSSLFNRESSQASKIDMEESQIQNPTQQEDDDGFVVAHCELKPIEISTLRRGPFVYYFSIQSDEPEHLKCFGQINLMKYDLVNKQAVLVKELILNAHDSESTTFNIKNVRFILDIQARKYLGDDEQGDIMADENILVRISLSGENQQITRQLKYINDPIQERDFGEVESLIEGANLNHDHSENLEEDSFKTELEDEEQSDIFPFMIHRENQSYYNVLDGCQFDLKEDVVCFSAHDVRQIIRKDDGRIQFRKACLSLEERTNLKNLDAGTHCTRNSFLASELVKDAHGNTYQRNLSTGHKDKKLAENVLKLMNKGTSHFSIAILVDLIQNQLQLVFFSAQGKSRQGTFRRMNVKMYPSSFSSTIGDDSIYNHLLKLQRQKKFENSYVIRRQCLDEIHISFEKIQFHLCDDGHKICTMPIENKANKLRRFSPKSMLYLKTSADLEKLGSEIQADANLFEHVKGLPITYYVSQKGEIENNKRSKRLRAAISDISKQLYITVFETPQKASTLELKYNIKEQKFDLLDVELESESKRKSLGAYDNESQIHTFREKLLFCNDDRPERPFVVCRNIEKKGSLKRCWYLVLIHLYQRVILDQFELDICNDEFSDAQITPSTEIQECVTYQNGAQPGRRCYQNFQVLFSKDTQNLVMELVELQVTWTLNERYNEHNDKYLVCQGVVGKVLILPQERDSITQPVLTTMFDNCNRIIGTQIVYPQAGGRSSNVIKLPKMQPSQFTFRSFKTYSRYEFQGHHQNEIVIIEAVISRVLLANHSLTTPYERQNLLKVQCMIMLNLVPLEILAADSETANKVVQENYHNYFEVMQGLNLFNFYLKKPDHIKAFFERDYKDINIMEGKTEINPMLSRRETFMKEKMTLLERSMPQDKKQIELRLEELEAHTYFIEMQRTNNFLGGVFQENILAKSIQLEATNTFRILCQEIFSQDRNMINQLLLMRSITHALDCEIKLKYFFDFFKEIPENGDDEYDNQRRLRKINFETIIEDQQFCTFNETPLEVKNHCSMTSCCEELDDLVCSLIIEEDSKNPEMDKDYEVEHSYIDFRQYILEEKLKQVRVQSFPFQVKSDFSHFDVADMISKLLEKQIHSVGEFKVIQKIIDSQFETSRVYYQVLFSLFVLGYFLPFNYQMSLDGDPQTVRFCMTVAMIVQIFFLMIEVIQMRDKGLRDYFSDNWNKIDMANFTIFMAYSTKRFYSADHFIAVHEDNVEAAGIRMVLMRVLIFQTGFMRIMSFMRVYHSFGNLVELIGYCIKDVQFFTVYFILWIYYFSSQFQIAGAKFEFAEYQGMSEHLQFMVQVFRNAIGDISLPDYAVWLWYIEHGKPEIGYPMMALIWAVWLANIFFCLIILLNFLIAIIGQSYEQVMEKKIQFKYQHRSELNRECFLFLKTFTSVSKKLEQKNGAFNITYFWSTVGATEDDSDDWFGMLSNVKGHIRSEGQRLKETIGNKVDDACAKYEKLEQKINGMKEMLEILENNSGSMTKRSEPGNRSYNSTKKSQKSEQVSRKEKSVIKRAMSYQHKTTQSLRSVQEHTASTPSEDKYSDDDTDSNQEIDLQKDYNNSIRKDINK